MIRNSENVARAIFEPKMIYRGEILSPAFELREHLHEDYISVFRMSIDNWQNDMAQIPQRKNRRLFGYAEMNVGEIRNIRLRHVNYDVKEANANGMPSHAGIFVTVNGESLVGGERLTSLPEGLSENYLLLAIRNRLVNIAQKGLHPLT